MEGSAGADGPSKSPLSTAQAHPSGSRAEDVDVAAHSKRPNAERCSWSESGDGDEGGSALGPKRTKSAASPSIGTVLPQAELAPTQKEVLENLVKSIDQMNSSIVITNPLQKGAPLAVAGGRARPLPRRTPCPGAQLA